MNDDGIQLVTARQFPNMTLVTVEVTAAQLSLGYPGMQSITVNIPANRDLAEEGEEYVVCRESCKGLNMGAEHYGTARVDLKMKSKMCN